jgi:hypothetical protein
MATREGVTHQSPTLSALYEVDSGYITNKHYFELSFQYITRNKNINITHPYLITNYTTSDKHGKLEGQGYTYSGKGTYCFTHS